jgi:putative Holliday junction resolvase
VKPALWIGLDVGTKTIGVARSERGSGHVRPWFTLKRTGVAKDVEKLQQRITEEGVIEAIVVGLPLQLDGEEGRTARLARQIGDAFAALGPTVHYQDERYSTVEASRRLHERGLDSRGQRAVIDQAAAAVILEDWLRASAAGR